MPRAGYVADQIRKNSPKNVLKNLAQQELDRLSQHKPQFKTGGLLEFIPSASPDLMAPYFLAPFLELLEKACEPGGIRAVIAAPPQHGKSVCVVHSLLWLALRFPGRKHAYITYSQERAEYVSQQLQALAESVGLEPVGRLSDVRLKGGTEIRFTSIGGSFTGFTVNGLMIIDDPCKDRADAESPTLRRKAYEWFIDVARSRRHPKTSIVCMATRWHPEDLSGSLIQDGYPYLNFKAIAEGVTDADGRVSSDPLKRFPGQALFPELKPPEFFIEERTNDYSWSSLYQGEPRGRGQSVFNQVDVGNPQSYFEPTASDFERLSIGVDFAYSAKTHADYSVAVVLGEIGERLHVVDVIRLQVETRHFRDRLIALSGQYPSARINAYVAATEQGGIEFIREAGLSINGIVAKQDKLMRAIGTSAAWNAQGGFKLPLRAGWTDPFLSEVCSFTGLKDRHDDQVDALAAAFDGLGPKPSRYRPAIGYGIGFDSCSIGLG